MNVRVSFGELTSTSVEVVSSSSMDEIVELLDRYRNGFLRLDAALLSSIWTDEELLYSPVELAEPIRSKAELHSYYQNIAEIFADAEQMDLFDIYRERLTDDIVVAYFRFRFRGHFATGALQAVEGRVTMLFRHQEQQGWQGVHYHESLMPTQKKSLP